MSARDPRNEPVTITLTAAEWDEIALYRDNEANRQCVYAERLGGRYKVAEQVLGQAGPPGPRREAARLEAVKCVPPLTRAVRMRLGRHVGELIRLRETGDRIGDHLGIGDGWPKGLNGWRVTCIWSTVKGYPNMHFSRKAVWFERGPIPMTDDEQAILTKLVSKHREVVEVWGGGEWLSVAWSPR